MKNPAVIAILLSIAIIGIVAIGCLTERGLLSPGNAIEIATLGGLILVTCWYAYSTFGIQEATADQVAATLEQVEISRRATEIALNATRNSVLPIITVAPAGSSSSQIAPGIVRVDATEINCKNIGKGPALNLKVWLRYDSVELGDHAGSTIKRADALSAGEERRFEWRSAEESLPLPSQSIDYDIVAEYTDIYRRGFQSTLFLLPVDQTELSFRQLPEVEDQDGT